MSADSLFKPIEFWAFIENSDFERYKNGALVRWDEIHLTRHDERLEEDFQKMAEIGCVGVRDAARWYVTHPAPGVFDWTWLDQVVAAAERHGLKLYLDLWHYGYPSWLDLMSPEAPEHFAEFARQIALRYPSMQHWCICNEPSVLIQQGGRAGLWRPFLRGPKNEEKLRQQLCRCIIQASEAVLAVNPNALLILPEPWHAEVGRAPYDQQALVWDIVTGKQNPELGGRDELVTIIGMNHYLDSSIPPFHILLEQTRERWPDKPLWITETSGPPNRFKQVEWFWWILAELQLAQLRGIDVPVLTWAPIFSMFHWLDDTRQLHHGVWIMDEDYNRIPNGYMLEAVALARERGYLK